jgi:type IV pilus assembly protein PilY1
VKNIKNILSLKAIVFIALFGFGAISMPSVVNGAMSEYCSIPPFVGSSIPPNVLIVLDNSGSMNYQAYAGSFNPSQFVSGHYYGYFDPTKLYVYNGTRWEVTAQPITSGTAANPIASGDFLNWASMRRVDISKKLLIGGKASPRSPAGAVTVKLYGEDSPTNRDFTKTYDNTAQPGLIYPFTGNYRYRMTGDTLYAEPVNPGTNTFYVSPDANLSVDSAWTVTGAGSAWQAVDDNPPNTNHDGNTTYIQNQSNQGTAIFDYNYTGGSVGTITSVEVVAVARKSSSSPTRRIRGILRISGTDYGSASSSLSTSYDDYHWSWATNPATGMPWQWSEINGSLEGFGGMPYQYTPTASNYIRITQVYLVITTTVPSGGPYSIIVDQGMQKAEGLMDSLSSSVRFGLAFYNRGDGIESGTAGRYDGSHIANYIDFGTTTDMITSIQNMSPDTWTPLGETLYEAMRMFRQDAPYYPNNPADFQTGQNYDPYYYQYSKLSGSPLSDQYVPCAKSFVLFLTDGESTMDTNIPSSLKGYSSGHRFAGTPVGQTYADSGRDYLIDVAYWGSTTDQRTLAGNQNIVLYPVFLFGTGSTLLKDAAIDGGFNDLNNNNQPDCTTLPAECYRDSNDNGVLDSGDLPLTYYEGDDGYALETSITKAIADILKRAASGTAVSVLTTSSRGVGSVVQAYFLPVQQEGIREVAWTGFLQNIWIDPKDNLREDTNTDKKLNLTGDGTQDKVIKFYFDASSGEAKAAYFLTNADGAGGGLGTCTQTGTSVPFGQVESLFEAGKKLAKDNPPSQRTLFTASKVVRGSSTTHTFSTAACGSVYPADANCFNVTNVTGNPTLSGALNPDATYTAENIVRYIRGECLESGVNGDTACTSTPVATYRDRRVTVDSGSYVWKLGDIISSTPKIFGSAPLNYYHIDYNDRTYYDYFTSDAYKKKSSIAFVGSNDGMLHAFRVGYLKDKDFSVSDLAAKVKALFKNFFSSGDDTNDKLGEEIWSYIPFNAFPYLKYLADPNYCHIYYNDLSVRIVDASIGGTPTGTRSSSDWRTILIGGMRFGGACGTGGTPADPPAGTPANVGFSAYFAIDITNPESPVPLWEFSDVDMGYSSTFPSIVRTGDRDKNGNWYVALGSGSKILPKSATDIGRSSTGYVYILDLETGALVKKIALDHNAIVGDILAIDADKDYHAEKLYLGTAYYSSGWKGKLVSIRIPNQDLTGWTPAASDIKTLFASNYPFTASPDAAKDTTGNVWVFLGSGKFYTGVDKTDTSQQIFFGLKDKGSTVALGDLDDATSVQTTGTVSGTTKVCAYDTSTANFGLKDVVTSINLTSAKPAVDNEGWKILLSNGERVISRPLAVGGLLDFLTYKPDSDVCSYGGNSYFYSVGYTTGVASSNVSIRAPEATSGTTGTVTVSKSILLGPGAPPMGEAIIIPPPKEGQERLKKKIQIATGVIVEAENTLPFSVVSKIVHWLKK